MSWRVVEVSTMASTIWGASSSAQGTHFPQPYVRGHITRHLLYQRWHRSFHHRLGGQSIGEIDSAPSLSKPVHSTDYSLFEEKTLSGTVSAQGHILSSVFAISWYPLLFGCRVPLLSF